MWLLNNRARVYKHSNTSSDPFASVEEILNRASLLPCAMQFLHPPIVVPEDKGEQPIQAEPRNIDRERRAQFGIDFPSESL